MIIRRIGPMSIARLSGMLYAVMGLIFGGIISLVALAGGFASDDQAAAFGGFNFIDELNYTWRHFRGPDGRVYGINTQH